MKSALFAAALLFAGTAFAQDDTKTTTETTVQVPDGAVVAPSNANPKRDARGIPVISDAAVAPPGFNMPAGMGGPLIDASQPPAPMPATQSYPPCTRTITDHCVQTYERGRSR